METGLETHAYRGRCPSGFVAGRRGDAPDTGMVEFQAGMGGKNFYGIGHSDENAANVATTPDAFAGACTQCVYDVLSDT